MFVNLLINSNIPLSRAVAQASLTPLPTSLSNNVDKLFGAMLMLNKHKDIVHIVDVFVDLVTKMEYQFWISFAEKLICQQLMLSVSIFTDQQLQTVFIYWKNVYQAYSICSILVNMQSLNEVIVSGMSTPMNTASPFLVLKR